MDHGYLPVLLLAQDPRHPVACDILALGARAGAPPWWRGIVHGVGDPAWLLPRLIRAPLAAWVVTPTGPPSGWGAEAGRWAWARRALQTGPMPARTRLIRRFVVGSQEEARALAVGVAMGRIACARGEEIRAVYTEVSRMEACAWRHQYHTESLKAMPYQGGT